MHGDRGIGPHVAGLLPRAAGDESKAIPVVAPDESGAASLAQWLSWHDNGNGDRHSIRLLAIRAVRRRIPLALRGNAVRHAAPAARVATHSAITFSEFLPKVNSRTKCRRSGSRDRQAPHICHNPSETPP